jgi:DNA integrity scanning protein DisA with diadenylate cyclase activity
MEDTILTLTIINLLLLVILGVFFVVLSVYGTEIKSFFSRLRLFRKRRDEDLKFIMNFINDLASVLIKMSSDKIGALIVIENKDSLTPYINIGNKIDSPFFPEFITSIFYNKKSPLHDGAIIVRD